MTQREAKAMKTAREFALELGEKFQGPVWAEEITAMIEAREKELKARLIRCNDCGSALMYKETAEGFLVLHDCKNGTAAREMWEAREKELKANLLIEVVQQIEATGKIEIDKGLSTQFTYDFRSSGWEKELKAPGLIEHMRMLQDRNKFLQAETAKLQAEIAGWKERAECVLTKYEALQAENAELKGKLADLEGIDKVCDSAHEGIELLQADVDRLQAENAELKVDHRTAELALVEEIKIITAEIAELKAPVAGMTELLTEIMELYPQTYPCEPGAFEKTHIEPQDWIAIREKVEAKLASLLNTNPCIDLEYQVKQAEKREQTERWARETVDRENYGLRAEIAELKAQITKLATSNDSLGNKIDSLRSQLAELRAGAAAVMESMAKHVPWSDGKCSCEVKYSTFDSKTPYEDWSNHIRALIPSDSAAALADAKWNHYIEIIDCILIGKFGPIAREVTRTLDQVKGQLRAEAGEPKETKK
jgi:regulator of replication initiation timing/DNA-directed RNA polymerase subunit RPC12/RpoP